MVVNKSTVPIGSGNWVGSLVRESYEQHHGRKANGQFSVASNPEFLREGTALHDSLYADRVVVGSDNRRALEVLYSLYRPILDQTFAPPTVFAAARGHRRGAADLHRSRFRRTDQVCRQCLSGHQDFLHQRNRAIGRKGGGRYFASREGHRPGRPHWNAFPASWNRLGGSCFGKDTSALVATAKEYNIGMPIVEAAREINRRQRERVVEKLLGELKILKGRTIGLLGLAFKPNTDDLREAPAIDIARKLVERGCKVKVHDPVALHKFELDYPDLGVICCESPEEVADDVDAVVLVTEWQEYRELDWEVMASRMRTPLVLDGRNALDRARLERFGFRYLGIAG